MGVPKRRHSKSRKMMRRSQWLKIGSPGLVECPQCHALKMSHRLCPGCGYYNNKAIVSVE